MKLALRPVVWAALTVLAALSIFSGSALACCKYGCCDCSCVALHLQNNADSVARSISRRLKGKGTVESFTVTVSETRTPKGWKCVPTKDGATCTRE